MSTQISTCHQVLPHTDAAMVYLVMKAEILQTFESAGSTKVEHISNTERWIHIFHVTIVLKMRSDLETNNIVARICRR